MSTYTRNRLLSIRAYYVHCDRTGTLPAHECAYVKGRIDGTFRARDMWEFVA